MPTAKARKLKVYQASFGFYDSVVAAANQKAALAAWGARQNLFTEGLAGLSSDEAAIKAARAKPGEALRRAVGSDEPFSVASGLPVLPHLPESKIAGRRNFRPTPDRAKLDAAQAALAAIDARRQGEAADVQRRLDVIEAEDARSRATWRAARAEAKKAVAKARRAFQGEG